MPEPPADPPEAPIDPGHAAETAAPTADSPPPAPPAGIDAGADEGIDSAIAEVHRVAEALRREIGRAIIGQEDVIEEALIALLASGHVLLEGVPGLAKTMLVRALALALQVEFRRIQFTPDLMPSDIVGTSYYELRSGEFSLRRGPIFTHLLLADEINRTPPKTQSALLEAMEERQVSIDGSTHGLTEPFMVFATQNPIEHEGTYPLPEAQLDRFMMKLIVGYPTEENEVEILRSHQRGLDTRRLEALGIEPVATPELLARCRAAAAAVVVDDSLLRYIAATVRRTRESPQLSLGASPRAGVALLAASRVAAAMAGRAFVVPDDVKRVARPVLRHRVLLRPESEIEGLSTDRVLDSVIARIDVPR